GDVRHPERHHSDPRLAVREIERQTCGQPAAQQLRVHRPVRKQQIVPALRHQPRRLRYRPRSMRDLVEDAGRKVHPSIMRRVHRLIFCSFLLASLCAAALVAQSASVSINNEPHHKRLLYTNDLRLWDVTISPGQSTPLFVHEYDVTAVVIGDGTLNIQRNGEALTPPAPNARGSVI